MEIVHLLIASDRVHVGIETLARGKSVGMQRHALPFRQRMDDDGIPARFFDIKTNRTLHPVQVVVQSGIRIDEKRRRYPLEIQHIA